MAALIYQIVWQRALFAIADHYEPRNGDAPADYLVAPAWCLDKPAFLRAVDAELERRDSWQGKKCHVAQAVEK